jgi:hypothetical protein
VKGEQKYPARERCRLALARFRLLNLRWPEAGILGRPNCALCAEEEGRRFGGRVGQPWVIGHESAATLLTSNVGLHDTAHQRAGKHKAQLGVALGLHNRVRLVDLAAFLRLGAYHRVETRVNASKAASHPKQRG